MKYREIYKRIGLSRKIVVGGLSAAFCAGTVGGSYAEAMKGIMVEIGEIKKPLLKEAEKTVGLPNTNPLKIDFDEKTNLLKGFIHRL